MSYFNVINIWSLLRHYNTIINSTFLLFSFNVNFFNFTGTPNGTPNSSPKRRKSKGKGSKLPPIGSKKSKGGRTENPTDQPSRMMKVGVHQVRFQKQIC